MALRAITSPMQLIGDSINDLPSTSGMPQGTSFLDASTDDLFIISINPVTGARTWQLVASKSITVGRPGDATFYSGGAVLSTVTVIHNFNFDRGSAIRYEIGATGLTGTLQADDFPGTTYIVVDKTGSATPNLTIAAPAGASISGPGVNNAPSLNLNTRNFFRFISKLGDDNWLVSGA